jgi:oligopeptide/dipeptide ABC transporter ATP-binding protein
MNDTILRVAHLSVSFATEKGRLAAVEDVSFDLRRGETLGLVGESGCGKSVTALSIMRLLPQPAGRIEAGRILLEETDVVRLPAADLPGLRGRRIAMIFQEPMTALNPVHRIGNQVAEAFHLHRPELDDRAVAREVVAMLEKVRIPEPAARVKAYPHQISGGMRQRVMIAMALAARPDILIADEPTTALDVTIQAQILNLMRDLQADTGTAVLFITHDLGVIAELCRRVVVMYAGRIVESARVESLFRSPRHPYTQGLMAAIPRLHGTPKAHLATIEGTVPAQGAMPPGCRFANRCPQVMDRCRQAPPPLVEVGEEHLVACYLYN